jgi:hypothetical protein
MYHVLRADLLSRHCQSPPPPPLFQVCSPAAEETLPRVSALSDCLPLLHFCSSQPEQNLLQHFKNKTKFFKGIVSRDEAYNNK